MQDRLVGLLGSSPEGRSRLLASSLERTPNEVTSYWLQLGVSIGIATLGLVVGSVAIIIGAMLVAPLMSPIIALALGLATGSPFLVMRSAARIALSVLVAIGGAALITVLLPFHELTSEIAARTSPTVLDLLAAGFCALAGVYASLRPGSDTAATAAGTSIGISLVPPLCASGYGIGTAMWDVAGGAALLFLTNLVAIIFAGSISYLAAGFNRVDATRLEREELAKNQNNPITGEIARRLAGLFESKAGPALRFFMPLALLAIVYLPLERALDEVAWQVRVRAAVSAALERLPHEVVQSRVHVERHEVDIRLVLLGKTPDAEASRVRLLAEVEKIAGVVPHIEILAIPDATAFAGLESTLQRARDPLPVPMLAQPPSASEQLESARALVRSNVTRLWPSISVGQPLVVEVGTAETGPLRVRVVHQGTALGKDGVESLGRSLSAALEREVRLVDAAIPSEPLSRSGGDLTLVGRVSAGIRTSAAIEEISVCVEDPRGSKKGRRISTRDRELGDALDEALQQHPRVTVLPGDDWGVRFVRGTCPSPEPAATSAETAP